MTEVSHNNGDDSDDRPIPQYQVMTEVPNSKGNQTLKKQFVLMGRNTVKKNCVKKCKKYQTMQVFFNKNSKNQVKSVFFWQYRV